MTDAVHNNNLVRNKHYEFGLLVGLDVKQFDVGSADFHVVPLAPHEACVCALTHTPIYADIL